MRGEGYLYESLWGKIIGKKNSQQNCYKVEPSLRNCKVNEAVTK